MTHKIIIRLKNSKIENRDRNSEIYHSRIKLNALFQLFPSALSNYLSNIS